MIGDTNSMIVHTNPDGTISILSIALGWTTAQVKAKDIPQDATKVRTITKADLPSNKHFRDAWHDRSDSKNIEIDETLANSIQWSRIRYMRNKELDRLDKEQLKVLSDSQKIQQIENQKQVLRDIPQTFNLILDVENPQTSWPIEVPNFYVR